MKKTIGLLIFCLIILTSLFSEGWSAYQNRTTYSWGSWSYGVVAAPAQYPGYVDIPRILVSSSFHYYYSTGMYGFPSWVRSYIGMPSSGRITDWAPAQYNIYLSAEGSAARGKGRAQVATYTVDAHYYDRYDNYIMSGSGSNTGMITGAESDYDIIY